MAEKKKEINPKLLENPHTGHRQRMRERFIKTGFEGFHDHEVLEILLFHSIRRRNVNPLAHRLINEFGSLTRVFEASKEELTAIPGVGPHTAEFIQIVPVLVEHCVIALQNKERILIKSPEDVVDFLSVRLTSCQDPKFFVLYLNRLGVHLLTRVWDSSAFPDAFDIFHLNNNSLSSHVIIVECTPKPIEAHSAARVQEVHSMASRLKGIGLQLDDYCVWGLHEHELLSFRQYHMIAGL